MASSYPGALDNLPTNREDATLMEVNHPNDHNNVNDAVNKIEAELGINPKGSFASLLVRLAQFSDPTSGELLDIALGRSTFNPQLGTAYTLVKADAGKVISLINAAAITLTIPTDAAMVGGSIPLGTAITLRQGGAGQVNVVPASNVTLHSRGELTHLAGQYGYGTLIKVGSSSWELTGDLA